MHITEISEQHETSKQEKYWTLTQQISQELIEEIGDLAYNTLVEFLDLLAQKLPTYQQYRAVDMLTNRQTRVIYYLFI